MNKLNASDLLTLESYSRQRAKMRQQVIEHKKARTIAIGPNMTWIFEDRQTIQYQVQEMLRIEKIFEQPGIQEELDAYNPLIPDGSNWKVTFLIEYPDENERRIALAKFKGVEDRCWVQVADFDRVFAMADEDLERENEEKTSSVHFLRFELSIPMSSAVKSGAAIGVGIDHSHYQHSVMPIESTIRDSLSNDLD